MTPRYRRPAFRDLPFERQIALAYDHLERLRQLNGGYIASPYSGEAGYDRYDVYWLRDIMYATYANEYLGLYDKVKQSYGVVLTVFEKFHHKIIRGVRKKPDLQRAKGAVVHARVHPTTLEEITDEWGHHQLDIFGLFLFKTGDLMKQGFRVIRTDEHVQVVKDILAYLWTARWDTEPDFGMWEEGPEVHSLVDRRGAGRPDHVARPRLLRLQIQEPRRHLADHSGVRAVPRRRRARAVELLPRESASRPYDFSQLSLLWPYNILKDQFALQEEILDNIEKNLVRAHGVVRYPGDRYFNVQSGRSLRQRGASGRLVWRGCRSPTRRCCCRRCASARREPTIDRYMERARSAPRAPRGGGHARRPHRRALHRRQGQSQPAARLGAVALHRRQAVAAKAAV